MKRGLPIKEKGTVQKVPRITSFYSPSSVANHNPDAIEVSYPTVNQSSRWQCFICGASIPNSISWINLHIDNCTNDKDITVPRSDENAALDDCSSPEYTTINASEDAKSEDFTQKIIPSPEDEKSHNYNVRPFYESNRFDIHCCRVESFDSIPGLTVIYDFISEEEELNLVNRLESDKRVPWRYSPFNGQCHSKEYGVVTQFGLPSEARVVRAIDKSKGECDMPEYVYFLFERLQFVAKCHPRQFPANIQKFIPNSFNVNQYLKSRKDYLKFHYDDRFLSGDHLMNLSLVGTSYMTYQDYNKPPTEYDVHLPRRCLQIVSGLARYRYLHGIKAENFLDETRISLTFRQAGDSRKGVVGLMPNGNQTMNGYVKNVKP